jgi:hypothetical protein
MIAIKGNSGANPMIAAFTSMEVHADKEYNTGDILNCSVFQ